MLANYIDQFRDADYSAPREHWSMARQAAWLIRFEGQNLAEALSSLGVALPGNSTEVVLADLDGMDRDL